MRISGALSNATPCRRRPSRSWSHPIDCGTRRQFAAFRRRACVCRCRPQRSAARDMMRPASGPQKKKKKKKKKCSKRSGCSAFARHFRRTIAEYAKRITILRKTQPRVPISATIHAVVGLSDAAAAMDLAMRPIRCGRSIHWPVDQLWDKSTSDATAPLARRRRKPESP